MIQNEQLFCLIWETLPFKYHTHLLMSYTQWKLLDIICSHSYQNSVFLEINHLNILHFCLQYIYIV